MSDTLKTGLRLFMITAVASMALGFTNAITEGPINEQIRLVRLEAKMEVLPNTHEFVQFETYEYAPEHPLILEVFEGRRDSETSGYAFRIISEGFAQIELYIGIGSKGNISGVNVVSQRETPGLGTRATDEAYTGQFVGTHALDTFELVKREPDENEIQAISGATTSSRAIVDAVNAAVKFYIEVLKEGR